VSVAVWVAPVRSGDDDGAVTVAVFVSCPVAAGLIRPVTVYVTVLPTGRFSTSLRLPVPDAVFPVAPPVAVLVNVGLSSCAERGSVSVAPFAADGPVLPTTTVYVTGVPGTAEVWLSVRVTVGFEV